MASFGLALNVLLWSVPAMVAASAVPRLVYQDASPSLSQILAAVQHDTGPAPSLPDAVLQLIGAEAEALEVAGLGLQQPTPADLSSRAEHAGARVLEAVSTYVHSAQAVFSRTPGQ